MIPYHFEIKTGKRGSSLEHISYITRMGCHSDREDLIAIEYGNMPIWSEDDPKLFFRSSDKYERKNSSAFRSLTFNLPRVLTHEQNVRLALDVVSELAGPKPFLLAVHAPLSSLAGEMHPHAHVMVSDRVPDSIERSPEQTFRRYNPANPEKGGCRKDSGGMNRMQLRDKMLAHRKAVADTMNATLERHGHADRVDHRPLKRQARYKKPERRLGPARIRTMSAAEKKQYVQARHTDGELTGSVRASDFCP